VTFGIRARRGAIIWEDENGNRKQQVIEYWPPTDARPGEGRLARVPEIEPLRNPPDASGENLPLVLTDCAAGRETG